MRSIENKKRAAVCKSKGFQKSIFAMQTTFLMHDKINIFDIAVIFIAIVSADGVI